MEKLLILLSVLMISGAVIPCVIAAIIHEKQEIKDEIMNLQSKDDSENFDESEMPGEMLVEPDDLPDVPEEIRNILHKYVNMVTANQPGNPVADLNFGIEMDMKIKSIHEFIPNGVIEKGRRLLANESSTVTNNDDFEQKIKSTEIILRTMITEAATISNTVEMSGEISTPKIPYVEGGGKIGFKFSKLRSTTNTTSETITKKIPSQQVNLKPHSSAKVTSELYGTDIISNYLVSFEIDESSTFTVHFKTTPLNAIGDVFINIATTIEGHQNRIEGLRLKSALQEWAQVTDEKYPTTTINCGSTPCIHFENDKVYIKYFPLEVNTVRTEFHSYIEKND